MITDYLNFWVKAFDINSRTTSSEMVIPSVLHFLIISYGFTRNNSMHDQFGDLIPLDFSHLIFSLFSVILIIPTFSLLCRRLNDIKDNHFFAYFYTMLLTFLKGMELTKYAYPVVIPEHMLSIQIATMLATILNILFFLACLLYVLLMFKQRKRI